MSRIVCLRHCDGKQGLGPAYLVSKPHVEWAGRGKIQKATCPLDLLSHRNSQGGTDAVPKWICLARLSF